MVAMSDADLRDPLDLTLREVVAICGSGNYEIPDMEKFDFEGHPREAVNQAFKEVHPSVAGQFIFLIERGLKEGYTAQGVSHPGFQNCLRKVVEDEQ